ncbi:MAG TPA: hypothetical protein VM536_21530 [Chloroflexia bacterium]|nr:hypothetical protein [Chloroflexia bacterium]
MPAPSWPGSPAAARIPTRNAGGSAPTSTDVFWIYVERVAALDVISGYTCGSPGEPCDGQHRPYYRWTNNVTRNQAAKIVANTFFPNCQTPQR